MVGHLCVFVSSTCHDLFQERHDLASGLTALGHHAIVSELPGTLPIDPNLTTFDTCITVIEDLADVVVVVVKNRYGSTDASGVSITRKEYRRARHLNRPLFVFVHRTTQDLYHPWLDNRSGTFPPVEDNRVFEFVEEAYRSRRWVFGYQTVDDILKTLTYQFSAMFKSLLAGSPARATDPVARAVRNIRSQNGVIQRDGLNVLVEYSAISDLIELLGHGRPDVRELAGNGLARLKATEAIPHLVDGLRLTGVRYRKPVIPRAEDFLAQFGEEAVSALLSEVDADMSCNHRQRWINALRGAVDKNSIRVLLEHARNHTWLLEPALTCGQPMTKRDVLPVIEAHVHNAQGDLNEYSCDSAAKWISQSPCAGARWAKKLVEKWNDARESKEDARRQSGLSVSGKLVEERLSSDDSVVRREAVIEVGESRDDRHVVALKRLLDAETIEDIYESAIKSLEDIGGERSATILESIWFGARKPRFAKGAARNALKAMGLWSGNAPLFNEKSFLKSFCSLRTSEKVQDSQRGRVRGELLDELAGKARAGLLNSGYSLPQIRTSDGQVEVGGYRLSWSPTKLQQQWYFRVHYEAVVTDSTLLRLIPWTPSSADLVSLTLASAFDIHRALKRAQANDMTIDLILDDRISISGEKWPLHEASKYRSGVRLDISTTESKTEIHALYIPYDTDWDGCSRLLARLARWLVQ